MYRFIFLLISNVLLITVGYSQSREYIPLVKEGKIWSVIESFYASGGWGSSSICNSHIIKIEEDTSILSPIDSVIYAYNKVLFYGDTSFDNLTNGGLAGFIRETADKKIFYISEWNFQEYLMYDFSAKKGDTISISPMDIGISDNCNDLSGICNLVVDSVDSVNILGEVRTRYHFDDFYESWIEGIGSSKGLLSPAYLMWDWTTSLSCFREHFLDTNTYGTKCYCKDANGWAISVNEKNIKQNKIIVSPNPANEYVKISGFDGKIDATIFDSRGDEVINLTNLDANNKISLIGLAKGIYIIKIKSSNALQVSKKLIII